MAWLPDGEKNLKIRLFVFTWFTNVTDRHTYTLQQSQANVCWMPQPVSSVILGSSTEAWHICSTPPYTAQTPTTYHVPQRILHKLGVTVHRCLQGKAPQYLVNCCHPTSDVSSRQRLRSSSRHHLVVPRHRHSTLGGRAFSVAGPMAWNALRDDLRDPSLNADNFRKKLKTHVFRNALGHLAH